jgi:hypothetical protein
MMKRFFTITAALIFALSATSCLNADFKESESISDETTTSIQATTISEDSAEESVQTSEPEIEDDENKELEIKETNPAEGEYFVYAILKNIDIKNNKILVEQLINEPNEKEIQPEVKLAQDCQIIRIVLEQSTGTESITEINLSDIAVNSEIGIIFNSDNTARAIISQEIE